MAQCVLNINLSSGVAMMLRFYPRLKPAGRRPLTPSVFSSFDVVRPSGHCSPQHNPSRTFWLLGCGDVLFLSCCLESTNPTPTDSSAHLGQCPASWDLRSQRSAKVNSPTLELTAEEDAKQFRRQCLPMYTPYGVHGIEGSTCCNFPREPAAWDFSPEGSVRERRHPPGRPDIPRCSSNDHGVFLRAPPRYCSKHLYLLGWALQCVVSSQR